jgi:hypothetical protein
VVTPKHAEGRDVPHKWERGPDGQRNHARRGTREERTVDDLKRMTRARNFEVEDGRRAHDPQRPPFCMLFEDLGDPEEQVGIYGMYPKAFVPKILPWLVCDRSKVLHVCSGGLPPGEGIRVDIRPEAKPDIVADGRALPLEDGSVEAVLIDPPYSEHYARELYGTDYPRPAHLLAEEARVVRPNGRIGIVHYIVPNTPTGCVFHSVLRAVDGVRLPDARRHDLREAPTVAHPGRGAVLAAAGSSPAEGWRRVIRRW